MKPLDLSKQPHFVIIIRAIHERGQSQKDAMAELTQRGLWLSKEHMAQAGLKP